MQGQEILTVGDKLPSFELLDQNGEKFNIDEHIGKSPIVVYFYPKDDTPGCTKEACGFRDSFKEFEDLGVVLIGISGDDVQSHKNFSLQHNLPFRLLSDTDNNVRTLFGVKGGLLGLIPGRTTYVADSNGKIIMIYSNQFRATNHIEEALKAVKIVKGQK